MERVGKCKNYSFTYVAEQLSGLDFLMENGKEERNPQHVYLLF